ncbi:MAG: MFS transporter [Actinomycetia bacterium]|nr:MFS transporter [Actinomycetes bacterium]
MTAPAIDRQAWVSLAVLAGAFDALVEEFDDTSTATLGWVLTGYTTVTTAVLMAAGRIADTYGRRRVLLSGLVVYVVTSAMGAVAWTPAVLIGARVGQSIGAALVTPPCLALLLTILPGSRRSTVIGLWGAIGAVAAATGPAVGWLIVDEMGWRWVFWLNLPLCILALLAGWAWIEENIVSNGEGLPDILGIVISAIAVGSLAVGFAQSGQWGWGDRRTVVALVVVLLFMAGFSAMNLNNVLFLSRVWGYSRVGPAWASPRVH